MFANRQKRGTLRRLLIVQTLIVRRCEVSFVAVGSVKQINSSKLKMKSLPFSYQTDVQKTKFNLS